MRGFNLTQGLDIEVPQPVEVPQSPMPPEILPPQPPPIPLVDPAPDVVEVKD